jgi:hypothetical protein
MADRRVGDPTRGEEPRATTLAKLADGQRTTAWSYENTVTVLEATLDHLVTLCELLHRQRVALSNLEAQSVTYEARLPRTPRLLVRARLVAKLNKARHDLGELVNA